MLVFLVTGVSGAGKSTAARALRHRGEHAISTDAASGLCSWRDAAGRQVERPPEPDLVWLSAHGWAWDPARLDEIISEAATEGVSVLWLCGDAVNAPSLTDRFDACFVLDIDRGAMADRIRDPRRGNDFGRVGDTFRVALDSHPRFVTAWRAIGAIVIDASQDPDTVVQRLLQAAAACRGDSA